MIHYGVIGEEKIYLQQVLFQSSQIGFGPIDNSNFEPHLYLTMNVLIQISLGLRLVAFDWSNENCL